MKRWILLFSILLLMVWPATIAVSSGIGGGGIHGYTKSPKFFDIELLNCNVKYLQITDNIETEIAAATAGDVLILAAGTYTITDDIDIAKAITLIGHGRGATSIATVTDSKNVFHVTASNVAINNLSIDVTASASPGVRIDGTGGTVLTGIYLRNLEITLNSHAGTQHAIRIVDASVEVLNCELTATSTNAAASGIHAENESTAEADTAVHIHQCYSTVSGAADTAAGFEVVDDSADKDCTLSVFNSHSVVTEGAACTSGGLAAYGGADAIAVAENCWFDATDYDLYQANSASLTVRNCTLDDNSSSGTITDDGTIITEGLVAGTADIDRLKLDQSVATLSANKTLVITDMVVQKLDPNGSDRDVTLPAEASSTDLLFIIFNMANGTGETLTVKTDAPATLGILEPEMVGIYHCDGTTWTGFKMLPDGDEIIVDGVAGTATIASLVATTADINAGTVDATIGGTTPAAGSFTDLNLGAANTGTVTLTGFHAANQTQTGNITSVNGNNPVVRKMWAYISTDPTADTNESFRLSVYNSDSMTEDELIKDWSFNLTYTEFNGEAASGTTTFTVDDIAGLVKYDLARCLGGTAENLRLDDTPSGTSVYMTESANTHADNSGLVKIWEYTDAFQLYDADSSNEIHIKLEALTALTASTSIVIYLEYQ